MAGFGRLPDLDRRAGFVADADKADLSDRSAIYRVIEAQFRVSAAIYDAPQHLSPMRPFETNVTVQNESRHLPHVFRTT